MQEPIRQKALVKLVALQKNHGVKREQAEHDREACVLLNFGGGAVIFGPTPRDHEYKLPKKVRQLALKTALSSKVESGGLFIVEDLNAGTTKTKELVQKFKNLGLRSVLIIDGAEVNKDFARVAANLPYVDVLPQQGINVYDILRHEHLVLTRAAIENLESRLK